MNVSAAPVPTAAPAWGPGAARAPAPAPASPLSSPAARDSAFSAGETAALVSALAPLATAMEAAGAPEAMGGLVAQLAERRARGEDVQVVIWEMPGGMGMGATIMSASELRAALESNDPDSLGGVTLDDGRSFKIRDLLRDALIGGDDRSAPPDGAPPDGAPTGSAPTGSAPADPALSPKETIAAAVANLLARAREAAARAGGTGRATSDPTGTGAATERPADEASPFLWRPGSTRGEAGEGPRVAVLSLPATSPGGGAARAGSLLLDRVA